MCINTVNIYSFNHRPKQHWDESHATCISMVQTTDACTCYSIILSVWKQMYKLPKELSFPSCVYQTCVYV